jgi:subtilisin family serine protease
MPKNKNSWFLDEIIQTWSISTGKTTRIYVLDSGAPKHIDLSKCINNVFNAPEDCHGHATHICGIIHQIAPDCEIVPVKITDLVPNVELIKNALTQIIRNVKVGRKDIINMSLSLSAYDKTIDRLITKLYKMNIPVVCAAGNRNGLSSWYPAKLDEPISVASYGKKFKISTFSPEDSSTDFYAPGENIWSTWLCNDYQAMSGTSQSCPYVAAVIALLLSNINTKVNIPTILSHLISNSFSDVSGNRIISPKAVLNNHIEFIDNVKRPWYSFLMDLFKKG